MQRGLQKTAMLRLIQYCSNRFNALQQTLIMIASLRWVGKPSFQLRHASCELIRH